MGLDELLEGSGDDSTRNHEPDEPFPEPDADHEPAEPDLGPSPPDPTPEVDGMLGPTGTSTDLMVAFWSLVVLFNVGLFGLTVGPMLLYFRGDWAFGGALVALGVLAAARGLHRYRQARAADEG